MISAGSVGASLAQRLVKQKIADGGLLEIVPEIPQGIALDLTQVGEHSV